jgi:AraC-like DNA-binding protein
MWVNKNPTLTKEKWEFVTAEEIYNSNSQWAVKYKANKNELDEEYSLKQDIDNFYNLIGYYVSEGSLNKDKSVFRLSQKKPESAKRIQNLIDSLSNTYKFSVSYSDSKGYEWRSSDKKLREIFSEFGDDCYTKMIPRKYIENTPVEYLETLLYSAIDGDGTIDNRENRNTMEYTTTSKQLADNIQEIAIRCGYRTNLIFSEDNRINRIGMWRVLIDTNDKDYVVITPSMCEKVYYQGKTYCLNVPNHIYLTRRNGKIAIQGNTARIKAILYERMIKSFQKKLSLAIERELFNEQLIKAGFTRKDTDKPIRVKLRFNSVTEEDDALRAKWLGNMLRGFPEGLQPFSINEIRGFFGLPHRDGMDKLYTKVRNEDPISTIEEEPEYKEEGVEDNEENNSTD